MFRGYFVRRPVGNELSLSEFKGGVLVSNDTCLYSIKFNKEILFEKTFANSRIETTFILNPGHFLVQFKNTNYFEIYDLFTGQLTCRHEFKTEIKFILVDSRSEFMFNLSSSEISSIVVILDYCEIHTFKFDNKLEGKLVGNYVIPPVGVQCFSCCPSTQGDERKVDMFGLTLENGGIVIVNQPESTGPVSVTYAKAKQAQEKLEILTDFFSYKIVHFMRTGLVLLGEAGDESIGVRSSV